MGLHPLESRKKRMENAFTVLALGVALSGMFALMSYDGERFRWESLLPLMISVPWALIALVRYVRGGVQK